MKAGELSDPTYRDHMLQVVNRPTTSVDAALIKYESREATRLAKLAARAQQQAARARAAALRQPATASRFGPRAGSCFEDRVLTAYYDDKLADKRGLVAGEGDADGEHQCYGCGHVCAHLPWDCPVRDAVY